MSTESDPKTGQTQNATPQLHWTEKFGWVHYHVNNPDEPHLTGHFTVNDYGPHKMRAVFEPQFHPQFWQIVHPMRPFPILKPMETETQTENLMTPLKTLCKLIAEAHRNKQQGDPEQYAKAAPILRQLVPIPAASVLKAEAVKHYLREEGSSLENSDIMYVLMQMDEEYQAQYERMPAIDYDKDSSSRGFYQGLCKRDFLTRPKAKQMLE